MLRRWYSAAVIDHWHHVGSATAAVLLAVLLAEFAQWSESAQATTSEDEYEDYDEEEVLSRPDYIWRWRVCNCRAPV